jgi:CRP-like cAMP-binding protein
MRPSPEFEAGALWLSRLDPAHEFGAAERAKVLSVFSSIEALEGRTEVREEGQVHFDPFLVVEGLVGCIRRTATGRRQMIAILVPGDLYSGDDTSTSPSSLSVYCLSDCRIAFVPQQVLEELGLFSAKLRRALRRLESEQRGTIQEWVLNLGGRSAATRLANLFCELFERLARVGLVRESAYELPLTQQDLADVSGLSVIHVNRILQQFRQSGLLSFSGGVLQILDLPRLRKLGEFTPGTYYEPYPAQ